MSGTGKIAGRKVVTQPATPPKPKVELESPTKAAWVAGASNYYTNLMTPVRWLGYGVSGAAQWTETKLDNRISQAEKLTEGTWFGEGYTRAGGVADAMIEMGTGLVDLAGGAFQVVGGDAEAGQALVDTADAARDPAFYGHMIKQIAKDTKDAYAENPGHTQGKAAAYVLTILNSFTRVGKAATAFRASRKLSQAAAQNMGLASTLKATAREVAHVAKDVGRNAALTYGNLTANAGNMTQGAEALQNAAKTAKDAAQTALKAKATHDLARRQLDTAAKTLKTARHGMRTGLQGTVGTVGVVPGAVR